VERIFGQQGALSRGGDGSPDMEPKDYIQYGWSMEWNVSTDEEGNVLESLGSK